jgi:hypothetical protein
MKALEQLRNLARYKTHGGYVWAAIMNDGELLCTPCTRENYRQVYKDTRDGNRTGWECIGITHSGESESFETCAHCNQKLWDAMT